MYELIIDSKFQRTETGHFDTKFSSTGNLVRINMKKSTKIGFDS